MSWAAWRSDPWRWRAWPFSFPTELHEDQAAFVAPEPASPLLSELVASIPRSERNTIDFLVELNQRLQRMIRCLIRMEPRVQTLEETWRSGAAGYLMAPASSIRD